MSSFTFRTSTSTSSGEPGSQVGGGTPRLKQSITRCFDFSICSFLVFKRLPKYFVIDEHFGYELETSQSKLPFLVRICHPKWLPRTFAFLVLSIVVSLAPRLKL
jgi:hypothetical protein